MRHVYGLLPSIAMISVDGESKWNWLEEARFIMSYVIVARAFLLPI